MLVGNWFMMCRFISSDVWTRSWDPEDPGREEIPRDFSPIIIIIILLMINVFFSFLVIVITVDSIAHANSDADDMICQWRYMQCLCYNDYFYIWFNNYNIAFKLSVTIIS